MLISEPHKTAFAFLFIIKKWIKKLINTTRNNRMYETLNKVMYRTSTFAKAFAKSFMPWSVISGMIKRNPNGFIMQATNTNPNNRTKLREKKGIIIKFAKIEIKDSLLNKFAQIGKIAIFVLKDIASALANFFGKQIFVNISVINGASEIIEKIHKNESWKPAPNNDNGFKIKIIIPAILSEFNASYL